jgi:hypothetical protein
MEAHLDDHPANYPEQWPCRGEIMAVYEKDHEMNLSEEITLYQVKAHFTRPCMSVVLASPVPLLGDSAGFGNERTRTLSVGQMIILGFAEGDPQLPYIVNTFPRVHVVNQPITVPTEAEGSTDDDVFNGFRQTTDKDGNRRIAMAEGKTYTVTDTKHRPRVRYTEQGDTEFYDATEVNGAYRLQAKYKAAGGSEFYDGAGNVIASFAADGKVELGGGSGHKRLLTEDFVGNLKTLIAATDVTSLISFKTTLLAGLDALTNPSSTSETKAK